MGLFNQKAKDTPVMQAAAATAFQTRAAAPGGMPALGGVSGGRPGGAVTAAPQASIEPSPAKPAAPSSALDALTDEPAVEEAKSEAQPAKPAVDISDISNILEAFEEEEVLLDKNIADLASEFEPEPIKAIVGLSRSLARELGLSVPNDEEDEARR